MSRARKYSDELGERAARLYFESDRPIARRPRSGDSPGGAAAMGTSGGGRSGSQARAADDERTRRAEVAAQGECGAEAGERDLEGRLRLFRDGARPDPAKVIAYVEERRGVFGVEPICRTLGVSVSTH